MFLAAGILLYAGEARAEDAPELPGLTYESAMELQFAECFDVYQYSDGYELVDVHDDRMYLLVPEGMSAPEGLDEDIVVLQKPIDSIYLAASAAMSLFDAIDALDHIRLSALQASGWYIDDAVEAMENGDILFAGKYSEPDYELLINENCDLAIESTMILHSPKVQEMIEAMDIPVFIDRSSYESHPLGRTEWVKLYGAMTDKEEEATAFFDEQAQVITELKDFENTGKTVAFFYVSTDGSVVVRKASDYVPKMIEIAGGRYIFDSLDDETTKRSSIPMTMEEFYATAVDADYLIYNGTIDDPIETIEDLLSKDSLFAEFKAVQEGNVWCAGKYLYQATDTIGKMITDIHLMLTDGDPADMTFMTKIN
jgi:iron complex transport system substrate-binding protein